MILFRKSYICMYSSSTVWKTAMHYFTSFFCRAALHVKLSVGCSRHYCWASSGLTLCWKESAVAIESWGSVRVFGGSLGGELKKRSRAGQRSLTLSSISDAWLTAGEEKFIKTSKLLTAEVSQDAMETRELWSRLPVSIWARWGTAREKLLFVLCDLKPPVAWSTTPTGQMHLYSLNCFLDRSYIQGRTNRDLYLFLLLNLTCLEF